MSGRTQEDVRRIERACLGKHTRLITPEGRRTKSGALKPIGTSALVSSELTNLFEMDLGRREDKCVATIRSLPGHCASSESDRTRAQKTEPAVILRSKYRQASRCPFTTGR